MSRTFVVGLDGASWRLIEPWIEAEKLSNIATLRSNGSWATSRSCLPPVTFPNWKCYSSGKNPGKLGVYWFERIDLGAERIDTMDSRDFRTAELWDYLNKAGFTTGVINMPTMYPPRPIDGIVICGGPDAVEGEYRSISSGYTYPSDLEEMLVDQYQYQVHPTPLISSNEDRGAEVEAILSLLEKRFEVAVDLFKQRNLDFLHVTLFYLNVLQHFFWNDEPTLRAWKIIDKWMGRLSDLEDTNLIVMSDHGAAPTTTEFYINEWLAANGYLIKQQGLDAYFTRIGITRETALRIAKRIGIANLLADIIPHRIQRLVPQSAGAKRERKLENIAIEQTKAIASGQGPIYINPDFDVDEVRDKLQSDLKTVTDQRGEQLFTDVLRAEDVYDGPYLEIGPDLVIDQRPGVHVNDGLGGGTVQSDPDRWAAENTNTGIFIANGPDFKSCGAMDNIRILDIMPTILAAAGVDLPTDVDGTTLPIVEQSPGIQDPITLNRNTEDGRDSNVENRLKQLGYME